jgi:hypothetical protein
MSIDPAGSSTSKLLVLFYARTPTATEPDPDLIHAAAYALPSSHSLTRPAYAPPPPRLMAASGSAA